MTKLNKQIFSVITAGALLLNTSGMALAGTTIEISGNGAGSDNYVNVQDTNTTTVTQNNNANVTNTVISNANTGNNDANFNTGGDVNVKTGDATTTTGVTNTLNQNVAEVDCCATGNTDVLVKDNGAFSGNDVDLTKTNTKTVNQDNRADVTNKVTSNATTGGNDAGFNTGGDVVVDTGNAKTTTYVKTEANKNAAVLGGTGAMVTPTASFRIVGNGAGSDNDITAALTNSTTIDQDNRADVTNTINSDANTGDNDAWFNTGGDVVIDTGDATATVGVDNAVNFNYAAADCGCLLAGNILAKINGNGGGLFFGSDNDIQLTLGNTTLYGQDNRSTLYNDVDEDLETGDNDANFNTGATEGISDPAVVTGDATSTTYVTNSGNVNAVGEAAPFVWELPNTNVEFSFNFAAFLAYFGLSM